MHDAPSRMVHAKLSNSSTDLNGVVIWVDGDDGGDYSGGGSMIAIAYRPFRRGSRVQ